MGAARNACDTHRDKPIAHNGRDTAARQRSRWGFSGQEDLSAPASRPSMFEVANECVADRTDQRVPLNTTRLGSRHTNALVLPIEVFQAQCSDFATAQTIDRQEHDHGAISNGDSVLAFNACNQSLYLWPIRPAGQALLCVYARRVDRRCESAGGPALRFCIAKEGAQRIGQRRQRSAAPTVLALVDEMLIDVLQGDLSQRAQSVNTLESSKEGKKLLVTCQDRR